jgi:hypothetical protein
MTNLFVIKGKSKVYGTYYKTICFEQSFSNEEELQDAYKEACSAICSQGFGFGIVHLQCVTNEAFETSEDVFEFLEARNN